MCVYVLSRVQLFATPWSLSGSSVHSRKILTWNFPGKKEYWSGLPFPLPGDVPDPGIEPASLASPALAGRFFTTTPPGKHDHTETPLLLRPSPSHAQTHWALFPRARSPATGYTEKLCQNLMTL